MLKRSRYEKKPRVTWRGCVLVYVLPLLAMTGLIYLTFANPRGPLELTLRSLWSPFMDRPEWVIGVSVAVGLYLLFPRLWSGIISACATVVWCLAGLVNFMGIID